MAENAIPRGVSNTPSSGEELTTPSLRGRFVQHKKINGAPSGIERHEQTRVNEDRFHDHRNGYNSAYAENISPVSRQTLREDEGIVPSRSSDARHQSIDCEGLPPFPGVIIRTKLGELGLSISAAAKGLGIARQHFYKVVYGESSVTPEMAIRLELGLGERAETWLKLQNDFDLAHLRFSDIPVQRLTPKQPQRVVRRRFSKPEI